MAGFVTRFAPSPTGPLHLGHAFSALLGFDMAQAAAGRFLLRIEDIDQSRSRPAWEAQIYDDLRWLGIAWETPVMRQSDRMPAYQAALDDLWVRGLLYPCSCTRRDIEQALSAPQEGVAHAHGPDGPVYPGTCRHRPRGPRPRDAVLRLNMAAALEICGETRFTETAPELARTITTPAQDYLQGIGDIVLARREMGTSYHLSVVIDDAAQGISHVVRGADLFEATRIHILLQRLLGLPQPVYHHHRLIRDDSGKRLAKRDDARALAKYRAEGAAPADIRQMVGL
ncbi:MAG: tRNA glutamyl-Q(34) synthetase GluQRS [Gemmobacter sp.]